MCTQNQVLVKNTILTRSALGCFGPPPKGSRNPPLNQRLIKTPVDVFYGRYLGESTGKVTTCHVLGSPKPPVLGSKNPVLDPLFDQKGRPPKTGPVTRFPWTQLLGTPKMLSTTKPKCGGPQIVTSQFLFLRYTKNEM